MSRGAHASDALGRDRVSAIPDRYRDSSPEDLALCLLAEVLDPPPPGQAASDPERWRQAIRNVQATLGLPTTARGG